MKNLYLILIFFPFLVFSKNRSVKNSEELRLALINASAHDTIFVEKGNYRGINFEITKPLTLIGLNFPEINAEFKGEIFVVKSDYVNITGFLLKNIGETSTIDWAAVKVLSSEHVKIFNNKLRDCYFGIYLSASNYCLVENNNIIGTPSKEEQTTGNGIHAWKCDQIEIKQNYIEGQRDGIYFEFVTNSKIINNYSTKNIRYGLHFMFSHNDVYQNNSFVANSAGVAVMYSKMVKMYDNVFTKNWGGSAYGLLLKDISDSELKHNYFLNNTIGVYMEGCNRINLQDCIVEQNGIGLRILANCDGNRILKNNFISNTFDIATNGSVVNNELKRNYWDKYQGYDLNKDGQGDISYRPESMFSTLVERMPQIMILLRSFTATLLDKIERVIPSFTPENLKDTVPEMKPYNINAFKIIT